MSSKQLSLALPTEPANEQISKRDPIRAELAAFCDFGQKTRVLTTRIESAGEEYQIPTYVNEFWTARQRQGNSLHEVSYRACFKPQLPRFFIERFTKPGDIVYDPFMGRGTTLIEAASIVIEGPMVTTLLTVK